MDYIKKSIQNAGLSVYDANHFVNPMAYLKFKLLMEYMDTNCRNNDKKCDTIRLMAHSFKNQLDNSVPIYDESFQIFLHEERYFKCDFKSFGNLNTKIYDQRQLPTSGMNPEQYITFLNSNKMVNIMWSNFSTDCSIVDNVFTFGKNDKSNITFTTLIGKFRTGELKKIDAKFISIPLGNSETDDISVIIVQPSTPTEYIYDFGNSVFSNVTYDDLFPTPEVKVKTVHAVSLPTVYVSTRYVEHNQLGQSVFWTNLHISALADPSSCNAKYNQTSQDIFEINRSFIMFTVWKNTVIGGGVIKLAF